MDSQGFLVCQRKQHFRLIPIQQSSIVLEEISEYNIDSITYLKNPYKFQSLFTILTGTTATRWEYIIANAMNASAD